MKTILKTIAAGAVLLSSPFTAAELLFPDSPGFIAPPIELSQRQKVIGSADFEKVRDLSKQSRDYKNSQKIAWLTIRQAKGSYVCSGSFVGPDLYLTNEHCVSTGSGIVAPSALKVYPQYLNDDQYGPEYAVTEIVAVDAPLDFALLRVAGNPGNQYGWLAVNSDPTVYSEVGKVKIIQHPAGRSKEISRKNNTVVNLKPTVIHYLADTEGGSSGSPVFSESGDTLIALHHVGSRFYNEAVLASSIYPKIQKFLPGASKPKPPVSTKPPSSKKPPAVKRPPADKKLPKPSQPKKRPCTANDFLTGNSDCE